MRVLLLVTSVALFTAAFTSPVAPEAASGDPWYSTIAATDTWWQPFSSMTPEEADAWCASQNSGTDKRGMASCAPPTEISESETPEVAFGMLLNARHYESAFIGFAGTPSRLALAFGRIADHPDASGAFADLADRGTLSGQLYALSGLYQTDRAAMHRLAIELGRSGDSLETISGCVIGGTDVANLLPSIVAGEDADSFRMASRRG